MRLFPSPENRIMRGPGVYPNSMHWKVLAQKCLTFGHVLITHFLNIQSFILQIVVLIPERKSKLGHAYLKLKCYPPKQNPESVSFKFLQVTYFEDLELLIFNLKMYQFRLPNLLPAISRRLATVSVVQFIFQLVKNFHSSFMVVCAIYCYAHYVNG